MSREWKPGSVVRLSPDDDRTDWTLRSAIGVVVDEPGRGRKWLHWFYCDGRDAGEHGSLVEPSLVRPLVVIDPEDREAVERLLRVARDRIFSAGDTYPGMTKFADGMQAALREFANPKPPKPDEPQGLGAVVEAIYDNHFVRENVTKCGWRRVSARGDEPLCEWGEIAAVRVLSPGVEVSA